MSLPQGIGLKSAFCAHYGHVLVFRKQKNIIILIATGWKETYQYIQASIINLWSYCPLDETSFFG